MEQVVRLLLKDQEDKILLVKHGKDNPWALPGGHIEAGENMYEAAHREIKEEFNFEIELIGEKDGIAENRTELTEYVKPISIYSIDLFSKKADKNIQKFEYIFMAKILRGEMKVQTEEIYEYKFFIKNEILHGDYEIYPQIKDLVNKYL